MIIDRLVVAGISVIALGMIPSVFANDEVQPSDGRASAAERAGEEGGRAVLIAMREASEALKQKDYAKAQKSYEVVAGDMDIETESAAWLAAELQICHTLMLQGKKSEAVALAQQAAESCETRVGLADPVTSEAFTYLAGLLELCGRLAEAEPVYRRNLSLLEAKYGPKHFLVAKASTLLGALLDSVGRSEEAEELHRRALQVVFVTVGDDLPEVCLVMTNLANCLLASGKKEEATFLMDRAFAIAEATDNEKLPSAGTVLRKQAEFYRAIKQLDRAEALGRRAFKRLAERNDADRAKFFYFDMVAGLYRSILHDRGMDDGEIDTHLKQIGFKGTR